MNEAVQRARFVLRDAVSQCADQSLASIRIMLEGVTSTVSKTHFSSRERSLFEGEGVLVQTAFQGSHAGRLALVLRDASARGLSSRMLGHTDDEAFLTPAAQSALLELTNIVTSGFLTELGLCVNATTPLIPDPPVIYQGVLDRLVVQHLLAPPHHLCLATDFALKPGTISGRFAMAMSESVARELLMGLGEDLPPAARLVSGWQS